MVPDAIALAEVANESEGVAMGDILIDYAEKNGNKTKLMILWGYLIISLVSIFCSLQ